MSIINLDQTPPTPQVTDVINAINNGNTMLYKQIQMQIRRSYDLFWNNPNFTPQEIAAAYGTDCVALFTIERKVGNNFDEEGRRFRP